MTVKKLFIITLMILAVGSASAGQSDNTGAQLQQLQEELQAVKARLDAVEGRLQENPQTARFNVDFGDDPRLGSDTAHIGIVEFSDYQCPFCQRFQTQVFPQLKKEYIDTGKVAFVFKDFPLPSHAHSRSAAVAANCADQQDDYFAYQKALFDDQRSFGHSHYLDLAKQQQLDTEKFSACLADKQQVKEIEQDLSYGSSLGVNGTPTFFIGQIDHADRIVNARVIPGALPLRVFRQLIDAMLANAE